MTAVILNDDEDETLLADTGIQFHPSKAACQVFAEEWIRDNFPLRNPALRHLSAIYSDHPDYRDEWRL